jgi:hypothetical protein
MNAICEAGRLRCKTVKRAPRRTLLIAAGVGNQLPAAQLRTNVDPRDCFTRLRLRQPA